MGKKNFIKLRPVCVIGRHGTGKSTLCHAMTQYGYKHISVGMLRRIAKNGLFPSDVPASLMLALKKSRAGEPIPSTTAKKLSAWAMSLCNPILDGFPASPDHLEYLPSNTIIIVISSPAHLRHHRLERRAEQSRRAWVTNKFSERENILPQLVRIARKNHRVMLVPNRSDNHTDIAAIAEILCQKLKNL